MPVTGASAATDIVAASVSERNSAACDVVVLLLPRFGSGAGAKVDAAYRVGATASASAETGFVPTEPAARFAAFTTPIHAVGADLLAAIPPEATTRTTVLWS